MMVDVVFHHIPKCGGSSVRAILKRACAVKFIGHHPSNVTGHACVQSYNLQNIPTVSMVRHPVSRVVSAWNYLYCKRGGPIDGFYGDCVRGYGDINKFITSDFFVNVATQDFIHFKPMCFYIRHPEHYDFIGRLEYFSESIEIIGNILGVSLNSDVVVNVHGESAGAVGVGALTPESLAIIRDVYQYDFAMFNYDSNGVGDNVKFNISVL